MSIKKKEIEIINNKKINKKANIITNTVKKNAAIVITLAFLLVASGCGKSGGNGGAGASEAQDSGEENETVMGENAEGVSDEGTGYVGIPALTDYLTEEAYAQADLWNSCDDAALAAVMKKAASGEKVTIAVIGGSITQGTISAGSDDSSVPIKKAYAEIFFEWWENTFPNTEFEFINAGIGATNSYIGVHRVQEDVLDFNPDLVLVEFSVNDDSSNTAQTNYDNLVRRILKADSKPAAMLLFMGQTNGATAQDMDVLVGFNYKLPMVSYINAINQLMGDGVYTASQLSGDEVHPSAMGHAIVGEILWKYLNSVYAQMDGYEEPQDFNISPFTREIYLNASLLDSDDIIPDDYGTFSESSKFSAFPNDWTTTEGEGGITFTVEFKRLGILYHRTINGTGGRFEVYVDGEYAAVLDGDFSGGWGDCADALMVFSDTEVKEHTVTIKKAPDSEGEVFTILGLMVAQ